MLCGHAVDGAGGAAHAHRAADAAAGGDELGGREKRESIQREGLIAEAQDMTKAKFVKKHGKEAAKFYETVNSKKK